MNDLTVEMTINSKVSNKIKTRRSVRAAEELRGKEREKNILVFYEIG
jgi:hypothetical protein